MEFKHILFPTDFSARSCALNQQVEWFAARFGSRVTLLHVFEIPACWSGLGEAPVINVECLKALRESAQQHLSHYEIRVPDVRVERVLLEGNVAAEIMNWVSAHDVDLIVMGTHGYGALEGWLLGSVTAKLLHSAPCPIWTDSVVQARPKGQPVSKILCAIEIIDETIPLLRFTRDLACELGADVRLIHSVPEFEGRPNRYFDFDLHQYLMESARVEISKMQREAGTGFPLDISGAGISHALREAADKDGADLVVIGRGKTLKTFGRFQSHVHEIIRYAPCPVLSYSSKQQEGIPRSSGEQQLVHPREVQLTASPQERDSQ
jgi:nucleotide-binding universal stress UspA family protein